MLLSLDWFSMDAKPDERPDANPSSPQTEMSNQGMVFGNENDDVIKQKREYDSDYTKLAMQGGHKGKCLFLEIWHVIFL